MKSYRACMRMSDQMEVHDCDLVLQYACVQ